MSDKTNKATGNFLYFFKRNVGLKKCRRGRSKIIIRAIIRSNRICKISRRGWNNGEE